MTDPRPDLTLSLQPRRFSLAALLVYVTAVGILLGLIRVAMYESYPGVIRLPAMGGVLVLFGMLALVLQYWACLLIDRLFPGGKKR